MEASAHSATIKVDPKRQFKIHLAGEQIVLLLAVLNEAHFKGSQAALAASIIAAVQDPVLAEAHGAKVSE